MREDTARGAKRSTLTSSQRANGSASSAEASICPPWFSSDPGRREDGSCGRGGEDLVKYAKFVSKFGRTRGESLRFKSPEAAKRWRGKKIDQAERRKRSREHRARRYRQRRALWDVSSISRVRACGRCRIDKTQSVELHIQQDDEGDSFAYLSNVQHCGSVWACPVCGAKIRQRRAEEIREALLKHLADGGAAYSFMLTLPHTMADRLAPMWDGIADGFRTILSGSAWAGSSYVRKDGTRKLGVRDRAHVLGTIRAAETTHGRHGWHPHLHPLVLTTRPLSDDELAMLEEHVAKKWAAAVEAHGYETPRSDLHRLTRVTGERGIASYLVKAGLGQAGGDVLEEAAERTAAADLDRHVRGAALDLTRNDLKFANMDAENGSYRGRSPWEILESFHSTGDCDDLALWHEYEEATKGRHLVTWSKGLKGHFEIGEKSDEELSEEEVGGQVVISLDDGRYSALLRDHTKLMRTFELAEQEDAAAVKAYVEEVYDEWLQEHERPPP